MLSEMGVAVSLMSVASCPQSVPLVVIHWLVTALPSAVRPPTK